MAHIQKRKTAKIPDVYLELPDHTLLTAKEIASIFGCAVGSIGRMVERGVLLAPRAPNQTYKLVHPKKHWTLGDVRKYISTFQSKS